MDHTGPNHWKVKLQNLVCCHWVISNSAYDVAENAPKGATIRQYTQSCSRVYVRLGKDLVKHLSQPHLVSSCATRGGCCARACQCCLKPRGLYPSKTIYYAHCMVTCGCCVRNRGFIYVDKEYGKAEVFTKAKGRSLAIKELNERNIGPIVL